MAPTIDVVIPTWRGRELLARCLACLAEQSIGHQVIVVDNASADGTLEMVAERFPSTRVVALTENVGFGAAVNAGVRAGSAEMIVLVNNDVEVGRGFLEELVAPLREQSVGMVASLMLTPGHPPRIDCFGLSLDRTLAVYCRRRGEHEGQAPGRVDRLAGPSGGAGAYRRAAFEQVDGFDETLFAYGDDIDLALRMRALGWQVAETARARAVHLGGATTGVDSPWQRDLAGFARGYQLRRYGVLRSRAAVRALTFECLVVGWGLLRHRTHVPLTARLRGWRAGAHRPRQSVPPGATDPGIGWVEAFRRLARR